MNLDLFPLGWVHLLASLAAMAVGMLVLLRPKGTPVHKRRGRVYVLTLLVTCVTALGIYRRGIFFFPHWLAIAAPIVTTAGVLAAHFRIPRKAWLHLHLTCLLTSLYILVGGGVNEVFLRVDVLHRLAPTLNSPAVRLTHLGVIIVFSALAGYFNAMVLQESRRQQRVPYRGGAMEPAGQGRVERRLAAILAADVAGYSRLIEADEEGTLGRLKTLRAQVIDPKIAAHRGRIVNTTGDGLLAEFVSVVDASRCAAEVQAAMAKSNAPLPPDRRIEFRIGINVGDIVVEDGDIFGDGVNVAARLEGLAQPGGICVSARVQEDAVGRLDLAFEDMGEQALKNIARPIRAYRVRAALTHPSLRAGSNRPVELMEVAAAIPTTPQAQQPQHP